MNNKSVWLFAIIFAALITIANYTVQIPINDWLTYGAVIYPFTFLLTDILSEKYGKHDVQKVVKYGVVLAIIPSAFAADLRIACASILTFIISQNIDIHIFHRLKEKYKALWWLRNNCSTMVSQLLDTAIFFTLAFAFTMPAINIAKLIIGDYTIKVCIAILDTPFFYAFAIYPLKSIKAKI
ncbi:queuosine precursor transporter [Candidatus Uabimicrobium amorphum]|uniref:Probable queuosine precursor transporter n=1 Tax=Uabimicrobium amorphum TaxID=2596890 RepID=A0A5S9IVE8_UABAM|nr:queuosine precursor transporter [Candidatus Uabimicrobium amorphum]BBM88012.1 membrane protein [Candidatus Uabimicrobium amorphum]